MRVMVIVKATKKSEAGELPSTKLIADMTKFNEELVKAGVMLSGEGLRASSKGTRVQFAGKRRTVIDGPFTETKELIAGFWLWQVLPWKRQLNGPSCPNPHEEDGELKIRQVFEAGHFGPQMTPELKHQEERLRGKIAEKKASSPHKKSAGLSIFQSARSTYRQTGSSKWSRRSKTRRGEIEMKFLSIYKTVERDLPPSQEEMAAMGKLIEEGMKGGWLVATEGCLPSALGARVRISNGNVTVTDGPFTEAKELVGGFAILRANFKEEAIQLAKDFRAVVGTGECELHQLYEVPAGTCAQTAGKS